MANTVEHKTLLELVETFKRRGMLAGIVGDTARVVVTGTALDSRRVVAGDIFISLPGSGPSRDRFVAQAIERGAVAVVSEQSNPAVEIPQIVVSTARPAAALASAFVAGYPSHRLRVIGVTGTDGKSTTCWLVRSILEAAGHRAGIITTVDVMIGGQAQGNPSRMTTPDAPELQRYLAAMVNGGDEYAVVEVSSHGLAQGRLNEVVFDAAVLTNIGHEHLDYHGTLRRYRAAKRLLFDSLATTRQVRGGETEPVAVINGGERYRDEFIAAAQAGGANVLTFGHRPWFDVHASHIRSTPDGYRFVVTTPTWSEEIRLPLLGRFNVSNALAAIGVGAGLGLPAEAVVRALAGASAVPGRMQRVDSGQPFTVVVDYAHTPEALSLVLANLSRVADRTGGKVITVLGSAGDRDLQKRAPMGRIAARASRLVVVTEEDPRSEPQSSIGEQIAAGAVALGSVRGRDLLVIDDRRAAIHEAMSAARPGDVVLLAGKGHERTIERATGAMAWDETGVAQDELRQLGYRR